MDCSTGSLLMSIVICNIKIYSFHRGAYNCHIFYAIDTLYTIYTIIYLSDKKPSKLSYNISRIGQNNYYKTVIIIVVILIQNSSAYNNTSIPIQQRMVNV